jgi:diguanylate cyclase (GGDEF)-like protein
MIDIDKFKNINDTYGHDVGDAAIKNVVNILSHNLRTSDLTARFGGEEFCVLLDNISFENTTILFEKIRNTFEHNILFVNDTELKFTVSIGIYYGKAEKTLEYIIKQADNELYHCKNNGRNQISING